MKLPRQAIVKKSKKIKGLVGKEITVLQKVDSYCGQNTNTYRIELPDGFPDPPKNCETWLMDRDGFDFI